MKKPSTVKQGIQPRLRSNWFQRYEVLVPVFFTLAGFFLFLIFSEIQSLALNRVLLVLFVLISTVWIAIITLDKNKPSGLAIIGAFVFMAAFAILFYRYSGARWDLFGRMFFNKEVLKDSWPILLTGLGKAITLFFWSAILSIVIGLLFAVVMSFKNPVLNFFIAAYVDLFRSIPQLVLVIFIYYALPFLGINLDPYAAGVIGLTLATSAFVTEYFRAGIESIHFGQYEAAKSLGFNLTRSMRLVILPQAIRVVIPPLTGQLIGLFKKTALISVVGLQELLKRSLEIMEWKTNPTPLISVTVIYLILLLPFAQLGIYLEKRMKKWVKKS